MERLLNFDSDNLTDSLILEWGDELKKNKIQLANTYFLFSKARSISTEKLTKILVDLQAAHQAKGEFMPHHYILILDRNLENSWELMETGLDDIVVFSELSEFIQYCRSLKEKNDTIDELLQTKLIKDNLVGESEIWKSFLREIINSSLFSNGSIYLNGETGTGKELLARLIHTVDNMRCENELIILDCTTIVPELAGSELFGHEKGSYTNAHQSREGAFAMADKGSLFMDEIGELPLRLQAEFLRVLQEKKYKKVGGNTWKSTDFRVISATNRNLEELMQTGKFRPDLYYRISDYCFHVPSLSQRRSDIPLLAKHFLAEALSSHKKSKLPEFDCSVMDFLVNRDYPGNVRELKQLVHRIACNHHRKDRITPGDVSPLDRPIKIVKQKRHEDQSLYQFFIMSLNQGYTLQDLKKTTMAEAINAALELNGNNKRKAAEALGITPRAIQKFLQLAKSNLLN